MVLQRDPCGRKCPLHAKQTYRFSRTLRAMFFPLNLFLSETVSPLSLNFPLSPRWQQSDHSPSCWTALGCWAGFIAVMVERLLYTEWDSTEVQSSRAEESKWDVSINKNQIKPTHTLRHACLAPFYTNHESIQKYSCKNLLKDSCKQSRTTESSQHREDIKTNKASQLKHNSDYVCACVCKKSPFA